MKKLGNYVCGRWLNGTGDGQVLYNAVSGDPLATASTEGLQFDEITDYARKLGSPALRRLSFQERGRMLKALALHLSQHLDRLYDVSYQTGATRSDSWIDIEGGIGNLFSYASLRRKLPDSPFLVEGESHMLSKLNGFMGTHLMIPKEGVAIHINAYNFPVWGMLEKAAVNWLAGMPAIVKPATVTSYLTEAVVQEIASSGILPDGALQLICGSAGNLLDHVESQDVVTFTGSASTGRMLRAHPRILSESVPFTMEADSLNCIVLGEDVEPDSEEWELFVKEVRKEMTVKAGQKCTAIRRIFVPENKLEEMGRSLSAALAKTSIGNPRNEKVRMGALAGIKEKNEVSSRVQQLMAGAQIIYGSLDSVTLIDADPNKGAFLSPVLLLNESPWRNRQAHEIEAFGPVSTLMPYKNMEEAIALSKEGKGSLCSTIVTASDSLARDYIIGAGSHHGRILILNRHSAKESTGHGSPLPLLVHGGPGRAGGGEEMGGLRGLSHYMQRLAIQGSPASITAVTNIYQPQAPGLATEKHPFHYYFEELETGMQLITRAREITKEDIDRFADLSGDHFYAHLSDTDFNDTMFTGQVAHGYFIMSAAAGLFVDSYKKNPVLLNYGIEELRFTKPVYPGNSIYVRFTCKEKLMQEKKEETDIARGIVKWYVEIMDDNDEIAGIATILTMVRLKNQ